MKSSAGHPPPVALPSLKKIAWQQFLSSSRGCSKQFSTWTAQKYLKIKTFYRWLQLPMGINYKDFRRILRKQCLWVSLLNPSLAPGLQGPLVNGVCSNLAPRVWRTFFLHQTLRKPTNCVVWQRFTRIQTQPMVRFSVPNRPGRW